MPAGALASAFVNVYYNTSGLNKTFFKVQQTVHNHAARAANTFNSRFGTLFAGAATYGMINFFKNMGQAAVDFERSFGGIKKTVEATDEQFFNLERRFRAIAANELPIDVN